MFNIHVNHPEMQKLKEILKQEHKNTTSPRKR
jgi:hypothetical protein